MTNSQPEWRDARLLYPFYVALCREFVIDLLPCNELEVPDDAPPPEAVENARQWLEKMDQRIQVHQLRQFLQTTSMVNEDLLRTLLVHFLRKPSHSEPDRDKLDFVLVQFFSQCTPLRMNDEEVNLQYVASILKPALGDMDSDSPEWIKPLDELIEQANACHSLSEMLGSKVLDKGRKIKTSCGEEYFSPAAMVAFTRFSFLMRRVFFRLMHQELNAILDGLRELELRNVNTLDCRKAQFSAEEPVARLRMICQSWKVMFHAEYSSGQPLCMLVDLRAAVDAALGGAHSANKREKSAAAAAGAGNGAAVTEFEVSSGPTDWNGDAVN